MRTRRPERRARMATLVAFATNGALPATLLARYAQVKDTLNVDSALFGLLVVGSAVGAAVTLQVPGAAMRRWGSRRVTTLGTAWTALAFVLAATGAALGNPWVFVAGLALGGYSDAIVDVAQNSQGLRVQTALRRSVLSSMHAGWSIGAAIGGLVGTLAARAGVPLPLHLALWGLVCTVSMAMASRRFLPEPARRTTITGAGNATDPEGEVAPPIADTEPCASERQAEPDPPERQAEPAASGRQDEPGRPDNPVESAKPGRRLGVPPILLVLPLALVALAGVSVEEIGNNWSSVLLATERGVTPAAAGIGLSVLLGAQFVGRLAGDRFIDRVGRRTALITSLALIVAGLVPAALAPTAWLTVAGLGIAGLGCAITVPLAFARADEVPGLKDHSGVTWVNWIVRSATIVLTPAIGVVAGAVSLPVAICGVSAIALAALALQLLPGRSGPSRGALPHSP